MEGGAGIPRRPLRFCAEPATLPARPTMQETSECSVLTARHTRTSWVQCNSVDHPQFRSASSRPGGPSDDSPKRSAGWRLPQFHTLRDNSMTPKFFAKLSAAGLACIGLTTSALAGQGVHGPHRHARRGLEHHPRRGRGAGRGLRREYQERGFRGRFRRNLRGRVLR